MIDVAVIGAGPNGLAAAAVAARAGLNVQVYEANETIGGAARTQSLDGSEAKFDLGSAVHPMALQSQAMRELGVHNKVDFIVPELSFAHVLDQGTAYAYKDLDRTVQELGGEDGKYYQKLIAPLVEQIDSLSDTLLNPLLKVPSHPSLLATFALSSLGGMALKNVRSSKYERAAALYAGCAAHVAGGSRGPANAGAGLFLAATAHAKGWPIPRGGSQAISDALAAEATAHGAQIHTGVRVNHIDDLAAQNILFDTSAEEAAKLSAGHLSDQLSSAMSATRRSPGSCLVHFVLSEPVPWSDPALATAGTVHLGGSAAQVGRAERAAARVGSQKPFTIVAQPSLFDDSRVPAGQHVIWAYCHVPLNSPADMSQAIETMIQRAAPEFSDIIHEKHLVNAQELEKQNPALIGGDLSGGTMDLLGSIKRPRISLDPWYLQSKGLYLISSAAPPGPSVHGMGGFLGAKAMLKREFGIKNWKSAK
ncbi:NAD(P)/FAD-dependent oxidoreductase [Arthrobacter sp. S41]|uniref:phytoene desaturase family protein n=1 Tax=Arthrobacter sp. S41 TaxID=2509721 RepID=UPI0010358E47|nr:NAD(P)/FAD-dependent oxidoreductase [Arthrobacter sp. S41]TAP28729.1 NAD(P)/FAD-dependent oxidoreductase [Arthrobacter sp. S41]